MRGHPDFLPTFSWGGEPAKLVEGFASAPKYPSTILRMRNRLRGRALPSKCWGGFLALAACFATPAFAQTTAITGGTVALGDGSEPIANGTVIVRDGKIV